jgi:flagellar biosynthetic protein FlhB
VGVRAGFPFDLQRFAGERTLPATPRRRQRARGEGRVAASADLTAAAAFAAAAAVLEAGGGRAAGVFAGWAGTVWGGPPPAALGVQGVEAVGAQALRALGGAAGPPLAAAAGAALLCGIAQTGFAFTLRPLQPDLGRISPLGGLQRMLSRRALVEAGKAALKLGALGLVVYGPARGLLAELQAGGIAAPAAAALSYHAACTVLLRAAAVLGAAGAADFAYRRYELEQQLRMTREEAREEQRETDGDPAMRGRRRRRARELARRRMLVEVRRADVVVTNPTHLAVALRYDSARMPAPQVVAKGAELMAERIRAVARASGVLIVENPPLARSLYAGVAVGAHIPPTLYRAAAEVLAYVWRVRGRLA